MEPDPGNRFEHLLKPIRDLSTVWNIDVAESLEKYCEEVSRLRVASPSSRKGVNFAEAALLIQGSTAIYSQKVEMLYKLVYEALELISSEKAKEEQRKRKHTHQPGGLWAPIPETEALLTVDHLLKDGRNIMFDESFHQGERKFVQRRLPLSLIPRDKADRRRMEFRISSCTVHNSGAYLLQESDSKLLDDLLLKDDTMSQYDDEPLAPPLPSEVADLDKQLQELRRSSELPPPQADIFAALDQPGDAKDAIVKHEGQLQQQSASGFPHPVDVVADAAAGNSAMHPAATGASAAQPPEDPWWCYNEDEPGGPELKLEVGNCIKPLDKKKLRSAMQKYSEAGTWEELPDATDEALWNGDPAKSFMPALDDGSLVDPLFLEIASRTKNWIRFATHKIGLSNIWLEFEDLLSAVAGKVKQKKCSKKPRAGGDIAVDLGMAPNGNSDEEVQQSLSPRSQGLVDLDDYGLREEEHRQEVERIESLIRERQEQYNDTIHDKLLQQGDGAILETGDTRFPELWANVQRWTEQLAPVLKNHESRPEFDIDIYGTKFLNKLNGIRETQEDDSKPIPFPRIVHNQPRWEVCRRFLTCLQLTNQGNTDITYESEEERLNNFGLQLLKMEKETISLEMQKEASTPLPPPPKRSRRTGREAGS